MNLPTGKGRIQGRDAFLFDKALRLKDEGKYEKAIEILEDLAQKYPAVAAPAGMLGLIYFHLHRDRQAATYFQRAVEVNPKSTTASRGLVTALFRLGKADEARDAAARLRVRLDTLR